MFRDADRRCQSSDEGPHRARGAATRSETVLGGTQGAAMPAPAASSISLMIIGALSQVRKTALSHADPCVYSRKRSGWRPRLSHVGQECFDLLKIDFTGDRGYGAMSPGLSPMGWCFAETPYRREPPQPVERIEAR